MSKEHDANVIETLRLGKITDLTVIPQGSNGTYLASVTMGMHSCSAIYKPRQEEKPLWDFTSGTLYKREYASYLLATALGWDIIPPTVIRNGPLGEGSLQLFLQVERESNYFTLSELHVRAFQTIAVFDYITNNADRKAGHCLLGQKNKIWSIDHGLTFHHEFKLRTVMVEFWGTEIPIDLITDLQRLSDQLTAKGQVHTDLSGLLAESEMSMLEKRLKTILREPTIPSLSTSHNIPWPLE